MSEERKKYRIVKETEKHRQVTHWDLDYLPGKRIRELYDQKIEPNLGKRPSCSWIGDHHLPLLLIAAGLALLTGSLYVISRL